MNKKEILDKIKKTIISKYGKIFDSFNDYLLNQIINDNEINSLIKELFCDVGDKIEKEVICEFANSSKLLKKLFVIYLENNDIEIVNKQSNGEESEVEDFYDFLYEYSDDSFYSSDIERQYAHDIKQYPILTQEEEKELAIKASNGDEAAFKKLVECNLRFVLSLAKNFVGSGIPLMELVEEGNIGLIKAVRSFNVNHNVRLVNYASHKIIRRIHIAIRENKNIVTPDYLEQTKRAIQKFESKFYKENDRYPNIDEISESLNIKKETLTSMYDAENTVISLYTPLIEEDDDNYLIDFITYDDVESVENQVMNKLYVEKILEISEKCLTKRQLEVLKLRYFSSDIVKTYTECEKELGIKHQAVKAYEATAIKKLKLKFEKIGLI